MILKEKKNTAFSVQRAVKNGIQLRTFFFFFSFSFLVCIKYLVLTIALYNILEKSTTTNVGGRSLLEDYKRKGLKTVTEYLIRLCMSKKRI